MDQHLDANKASLIRVKTVLDLTKSAREIYESSKVEEKRQILNFVFSNLEMKDKKPIITLRESFDKLLAVSDRPTYRKRRTLTLEGLRWRASNGRCPRVPDRAPRRPGAFVFRRKTEEEVSLPLPLLFRTRQTEICRAKKPMEVPYLFFIFLFLETFQRF
ncbi:MAG: hypothetical protein K940chlam6_00141 [Chlamydiae bacterium]|nr:hypothetical protein [Chlamydiota bacterium]